MPRSRSEALDQLEAELGVLLRRVRAGLAERARTTHPELTVPGYLILQRLQQTGPRRSSGLAEELGIDKGAVSRQVNQLVAAGLVDRTADPDDGRAQQLAISATGLARMSETHEQRRQMFADRLGEWSDQDLADLADRLARYNAALGGSLTRG